MTPSFLAFMEVFVRVEEAILLLAAAQAATAVGIFVVALSLERFFRFVRIAAKDARD